MSLRFQWQYTISIRETPVIDMAAFTNEKQADNEIISIVVCHLSPRETDKILPYFQKMTPEATTILAYGGSKDNFSKISYENKFYIEDDRIRGIEYKQSYFGLFDNLKSWLQEHKKEASWIIISDYECLPIGEGWEKVIINVTKKYSGGFGGKLINNRTGDNSLFVANAVSEGIIKRLENKTPSKNIDLYHCLGAIISHE